MNGTDERPVASKTSRATNWRRMFEGELPRREVFAASLVAGVLILVVATGAVTGTAVEVLGVVTGLSSVWFALREHPLTWVATIINTASFAVIFWVDGAYANVGLQGVQLAICVYGWAHWLGGGVVGQPDLPVTRTPAAEWAIVAAIVAGLSIALLALHGAGLWSTPMLDATSASLGVGALFLQARKRVECWPLWIAMMLLLWPLFIQSGSAIMIAFVPMGVTASVVGFMAWLRRLR